VHSADAGHPRRRDVTRLLAILIVPPVWRCRQSSRTRTSSSRCSRGCDVHLLLRRSGWTRSAGGERIQATWNQLASEGVADLVTQVQPHARAVAAWLAQQPAASPSCSCSSC